MVWIGFQRLPNRPRCGPLAPSGMPSAKILPRLISLPAATTSCRRDVVERADLVVLAPAPPVGERLEGLVHRLLGNLDAPAARIALSPSSPPFRCRGASGPARFVPSCPCRAGDCQTTTNWSSMTRTDRSHYQPQLIAAITRGDAHMASVQTAENIANGRQPARALARRAAAGAGGQPLQPDRRQRAGVGDRQGARVAPDDPGRQALHLPPPRARLLLDLPHATARRAATSRTAASPRRCTSPATRGT